ncbi:MAG: HlyD family efflux transporter periplasmic adaptor subunit [Pseudomonadota bacterium]
MRASHTRLMIWGGLGIAVIALLAFLFRPRAEPVDVVVVSRADLLVTVDEEGRTRVRDVYIVSAPVAGTMRRVILEPGDPVAAAETVVARIAPTDAAFLDPRDAALAEADVKAATSSLALARASLDEARADKEFADRELDRGRELVNSGTIAEREFDALLRAARAAQARLDTAQAAVQVRLFELERARAALIAPNVGETDALNCCDIPVTAPVNGRVLQVLRESAGVVAAGAPLIEVGDPSALEVVVELLSADAVQVLPGQDVSIEEWGGSVALSGTVRRVEPFGFEKVSSLGIEEQRVNVVIDFAGEPDDATRLGHGYRVVARIVLDRAQDALVVPATALFRQAGQWSVFVVDDGYTRLRSVTVGKRSNVAAEISAGLADGERIVAFPSSRIEDGIRVTARAGGSD